MRVFAYRHWGTELAFVGDWPPGEVEERLVALHEQLWSDSPPGLREEGQEGQQAAIASLDHPLARVLTLMYHLAEQRPDGGSSRALPEAQAEQLRQAALGVLRQPPIAHASAYEVPQLRARALLDERDGTFVRQLAVAALRQLARAEDFGALWARLGPALDSAMDEERAAAVCGLAALAGREPVLLQTTGLLDHLLALARGDRSAAVRVAAVRALMTLSPSEPVCAALRDIVVASVGAPEEPEWAAVNALYQREPAAYARLLLDVHLRSDRPPAFRPTYAQLDLLAEEATLRLYLGREGAPGPLIWRDFDGAVFALCLQDGTAPAGADDPQLSAIAARWVSAVDDERAALRSRLSDRGHAAGRALAILAAPLTADEQQCLDEDDAEPDSAAAPPLELDWLALARRVLLDPPLIRLSAADVAAEVLGVPSAPIERFLFERAVPGCNHQMALKVLPAVAEPGDRDAGLMASCFLQTRSRLTALSETPDTVSPAALAALYWHSRRFGQPPPGAQLLEAVCALARDGSGEARRGAVQLLGRWPAAQTAELLQTLTSDPTYSVCCVADRALAEQQELPAP